MIKKYRVEVENGVTRFYKWGSNGKILHREGGPACEHPDGSKEWCLNGKLHREDGPALEIASGTKEWYLNGLLHREDGPAIEYANGYKHWYLQGTKLSEDEFKAGHKAPCAEKVVEVEGVKYKLTAI